jgi:hypothetical protein
MKSLSLDRCALSGGVAIVLLAGCGALPLNLSKGQDDMQPAVTAPGEPPSLRNAVSGNKTFKYTGEKQSFVVPAGVHEITVVVRGAAGTGCTAYIAYYGGPYGRGGRVYAVIPVTQRERLDVYVGGEGSRPVGGFNGEGNGAGPYSNGGGGASDVRTAPGRLQDRILVAGGGGGRGSNDSGFSSSQYGYYGCGGGGGGLVGGQGQNGFSELFGNGRGGAGGTQTQGGAGGKGGSSSHYCRHAGHRGGDGTRDAGGNGGRYSRRISRYFWLGGGGGGGGYFGGGGGGSACNGYEGGGGGGGGSSYAEHTATKVKYWQNWKNATSDGLVVFSW